MKFTLRTLRHFWTQRGCSDGRGIFWWLRWMSMLLHISRPAKCIVVVLEERKDKNGLKIVE